MSEIQKIDIDTGVLNWDRLLMQNAQGAVLFLGLGSHSGWLHRLAVADALVKSGYNPDEPRVPAGNPDGGQWTGDGDGDGIGDSEDVDGDEGDENTDNDSGQDTSDNGEVQQVADAHQHTLCVDQCYEILERPKQLDRIDGNHWDYLKCYDECMRAEG